MMKRHNSREQSSVVSVWHIFLHLVLTLAVVCQAEQPNRQWTVYLAQDKHLDYNWCGSTSEIESRMVTVLDYYLDAVEKNECCWNLDGTLWDEVYRRHRGPAGSARLHDAIREGRIGYPGNYAVLLWGILDTETAIRACYGAAAIEKSTGIRARTALVTENPGMTWGIANILTDCGFDFLGRGIYPLRAESYHQQRGPYPLFWWKAPNGKCILVRWDLYQDTKSWGGYAEAHSLASMAGEKWNAFEVQSFGDRNTEEIFQKRKEFIEQTVRRYEAYGDNYPISSILLMGTGWDNWTLTHDFSAFVRKFNAQTNGPIRLVDGRYEDFFIAADREIREKELVIPVLEGSFGICWEEWAAHLAGPTGDFRKAERLLRLAEASDAIETMFGRKDSNRCNHIWQGFTELLKFAEHDFGGTDRERAALSASARTKAVTQAMDISRSMTKETPVPLTGDSMPEELSFEWQGGRVVFDPNRCGVASLTNAEGRVWVTDNQDFTLGEFKHTRYRTRAKPDSVFPEPLRISGKLVPIKLTCQRSGRGVQIVAEFDRSGFRVESTWLFHAANPWIDITYRLKDGWSDDPQTVEFCFPFAIDKPTYRYDAPGAFLIAGQRRSGGDDLPGANPELFAGVTFAAASGSDRTALLLTPNTLLLRFGQNAFNNQAQITSMPMMNLTGNDWQFGQGGWTEWSFRYRIVFLNEEFNCARAVQEAQQFATPPFLQVPGQVPVVSGLEVLDIRFPGGPLLAFKVAEDNQRLILRFWNVLNSTVQGSLKTPSGWSGAEICDALERPAGSLEAKEGRIRFSTGPLEIVTIALLERR